MEQAIICSEFMNTKGFVKVPNERFTYFEITTGLWGEVLLNRSM